MSGDNASVPQMSVEQIRQEPDAVPGVWWVTWRIQNVGDDSLQFVEAHVPHGRFRGQRADLSSVAPVAAGTAREIQLAVVFMEPPGTVVENAFLILTAISQQTSWRILIRMTVESGRVGAPMAKTELITTQEVGFSASRREVC